VGAAEVVVVVCVWGGGGGGGFVTRRWYHVTWQYGNGASARQGGAMVAVVIHKEERAPCEGSKARLPHIHTIVVELFQSDNRAVMHCQAGLHPSMPYQFHCTALRMTQW